MMKIQILFGVLFAVLLCTAPAEAAMKLESSEHWVRVEFDALPQTAAEVAPCQTPEETAALTVAALVRYTEDQEAGIAMLNVLRGPRPLSPQDIQLLKDQLLKDRNYVARSHFNGATPDNNYTPLQPYSAPSRGSLVMGCRGRMSMNNVKSSVAIMLLKAKIRPIARKLIRNSGIFRIRETAPTRHPIR